MQYMEGFPMWTFKKRLTVYFSFDRENDFDRACDVISCVRSVARPADGFSFFHGKHCATGSAGIERNLEGTVATVVIIGSHATQCPAVKDEVKLSIERGNGLLGLYIQREGRFREKATSCGTRPVLLGGVKFQAYDWDGNLERFAWEVKAAAKRSARDRRPDLEYFPALGW